MYKNINVFEVLKVLDYYYDVETGIKYVRKDGNPDIAIVMLGDKVIGEFQNPKK